MGARRVESPDDLTKAKAGTVSSPHKSLLDPVDAISEVLFGLIMVLTTTGSISIATAGGAEVHEMLLGALGGNLAWGIIDGVFYLLGCLEEKSRDLRVLRAVRAPASSLAGQQALVGALPQPVASVLQPAELEDLRRRLALLPAPPGHPHLDGDDVKRAMLLGLLVPLSAVPVVMPFLFIPEPGLALRVSNGIAVLMMFFAGYAHGQKVSQRPWRLGLAMVLLGGALVTLTIALGG